MVPLWRIPTPLDGTEMEVIEAGDVPKRERGGGGESRDAWGASYRKIMLENCLMLHNLVRVVGLIKPGQFYYAH